MAISTEVIGHLFLPSVFVSNCHKVLMPYSRPIVSTPYPGYAKNLAPAITRKWDSYFTAFCDFGHIKSWSRKTITMLLEEGEASESRGSLGKAGFRFCGRR